MVRKSIAIIALFCFYVTFVHTAPQDQPRPRYEVVSEKFHQDPNLEYAFEWVILLFWKKSSIEIVTYSESISIFRQEFANGEKFNEDGKLKNVGGMDVIVTKGSYTIKNPDGTETIVNYTADEEGFHPEIVTPSTNKQY